MSFKRGWYKGNGSSTSDATLAELNDLLTDIGMKFSYEFPCCFFIIVVCIANIAPYLCEFDSGLIKFSFSKTSLVFLLN